MIMNCKWIANFNYKLHNFLEDLSELKVPPMFFLLKTLLGKFIGKDQLIVSNLNRLC